MAILRCHERAAGEQNPCVLGRKCYLFWQGFFTGTVYLVKPPQPTNVIATIENAATRLDGGVFA
jgi:hypothetical protein